MDGSLETGDGGSGRFVGPVTAKTCVCREEVTIYVLDLHGRSKVQEEGQGRGKEGQEERKGQRRRKDTEANHT